MDSKNKIPYKQELMRKSIHLASICIPIAYVYTDREHALLFFIPFTILVVFADLLSKRVEFIRSLIYIFFGKMMRPHELNRKYTLNGASWVMISATLCILIFPKIIAVTAFSVLIISDVTAALVGRKIGKTKFLDKSLEGSTAFLISAIVTVSVIGMLAEAPLIYYLFGYLGSVFGALAEASSRTLKLDDNLSIPASIGGILFLGNYIAGFYGQSYVSIL